MADTSSRGMDVMTREHSPAYELGPARFGQESIGRLALDVTVFDRSFWPAAYHTLTGERRSYEELIQEHERLEKIPPAERRRDHNLLEHYVVVDGLKRIQDSHELQTFTTLLGWPMYAELWNRNVSLQKEAAFSGSREAILLGALSPLSSKVFHRQAKYLYGMDRSQVIDLAGGRHKLRAENGPLVLGDILKLPSYFKDGAFRLAQTNFLLHMLTNPEGRRTKDALSTFSENVYRVLTPGGHLLMSETYGDVEPFVAKHDSPPNRAPREAMEEDVKQNLALAGFVDIQIQPAWHPKNASYLLRNAQQPNIPQEERDVAWGAFSVYARKPE